MTYTHDRLCKRIHVIEWSKWKVIFLFIGLSMPDVKGVLNASYKMQMCR